MEARWGSNARGEGEEEKPSEKRRREGKRVGTASAFSFGRAGGRREGVLKEGEARGEQARKEAEGEWERKIERDERAVCMHRGFISQRSRGKKGEKVSRVCYAKWR